VKFDQPTLVTLTAPTCAGKDYLLQLLIENLNFVPLISCTTRQKRAGETHGRDYYFVSQEQFEKDEAAGVFCETAEFRGTKYGVTWGELDSKISSGRIPVVILEPTGVEHFQQICAKHNWNIFKIFISTPEDVRLNRLCSRTAFNINCGRDEMIELALHTDRVVSILTEERRWGQTNTWDAIVPGNDAEKALEMVRIGIRWRNRRNAVPTPYEHKL
jgi:guanylate kinase